jgi:HAMP domain-containing protein
MYFNRLSISARFTLVFVFIVGLYAAISYSILWNVYQQELKSQAKSVVSNVEAFGAWVAQSGRIWVKDNAADSYLGEQTFIPTSGVSQDVVHFYSKNPALAQREFSEAVAKSDSPAKFRMTSLNVMNINNAPDAFEKLALEIVTSSGSDEHIEFIDGNYRYAKAVHHKASCIACHGDANNAPADVIARYGKLHGFGFKEGDVAGIISVTIPTKPLYIIALSFVGVKEVVLFLMSFVLLMWFVRKAIINPVTQLTNAAHEISIGRDAEIDVGNFQLSTKNEINLLALALNRMKNSTQLAIKKMNEAKSAFEKVIKQQK